MEGRLTDPWVKFTGVALPREHLNHVLLKNEAIRSEWGSDILLKAMATKMIPKNLITKK